MANRSAGRATIPLGLGLFELEWNVDVMRTDGGDHCPGLLGNEVLQEFNVTIPWQYIDNGDALMVWPELRSPTASNRSV